MPPTPVECVEGCGGDSLLAVASIAIATISVIVAAASLYTNRHMLRMARTEHQVFLDMVLSRADFKLDVWIQHHEVTDGVIETDADRIGVQLQLGIANTGKKAASSVGVNLLAPTTADVFTWITPQGQDLGGRDDTSGPVSTAEELVAEDGTRHPAHFLIRQIHRVGLRDSHVSFAKLSFRMPPQPGSEIVVPVKFKVWADELPDDLEDRVRQIEFRLRRVV